MISAAPLLVRLLRQAGHAFCQANGLAFVWPGTLGIRCFPEDPNKVRRPDVSLLRREPRLPCWVKATSRSLRPCCRSALAQRPRLRNDEKVEEYLRPASLSSGSSIPKPASFSFIARMGSTAKLRVSDDLSGEDVVPDFGVR